MDTQLSLYLDQDTPPKGPPRKRRRKNLERLRMSKPDIRKDCSLYSKFGIGLREYRALEIAQGGVCAICGMPETKMQARNKNGIKSKDSLHVDHDHKTGNIRGLLCYRCNTGIGKLLDSPDILRRAADYIEMGGWYGRQGISG